MNYEQFLEAVIRKGIEGAKRDYSNPRNKNHPMMLEGAIAGFEVCRNKTPQQLKDLLDGATTNTTRARLENLPDYWKHRCYHLEIEWVCNCVGALLMNQGLPPIGIVTCRGIIMAAEILNERSTI